MRPQHAELPVWWHAARRRVQDQALEPKGFRAEWIGPPTAAIGPQDEPWGGGPRTKKSRLADNRWCGFAGKATANSGPWAVSPESFAVKGVPNYSVTNQRCWLDAETARTFTTLPNLPHLLVGRFDVAAKSIAVEQWTSSSDCALASASNRRAATDQLQA